MHIIISGTAIAAAAVLFAGCNTAFTGTTADMGTAESNKSTVQNSTAKSTVVTVASEGILYNAADQVITATYTYGTGSVSKVDPAATAAAVKLYPLSAAADAYHPYVEGTAIPVTYMTSVDTGSAVMVYYKADLSSVTTTSLEYYIDATVLSDRNGTKILNGNGNEIAGEASDSIIGGFAVAAKLGSTLTAPAAGSGIRAVTSSITLAPVGPFYTTGVAENTSNTNTMYYVVKAAAENYTSASGTATKNVTGLDLTKVYSLQYKDAGSVSWNNVSFTCTAGGSVAGTTYLPSDGYYVLSSNTAITAGQKFRLVTKKSNALYTDSTKDACGAASYYSYLVTPQTTYGDWTDAYVGSDSDGYILSTTALTAGSAVNTAFATRAAAQQSLFSVVKTGNGYAVTFTGTTLAPLGFTGTDFIVTNKNNVRIPATVTVISNAANTAVQLGSTYGVGVVINDVNLDNTDFKLWIGSGVTVVNIVNGSETKFGTYKNATNGDASGYVQLK